MKIGRYFTLAELTHSETAARRGWPNDPPPEVVQNLKNLCTHVLDPLRDAVGGPVVITSGYRSPVVNRAVRGSSSSQHVLGLAADLVVPGMTVAQVVRKIRTTGIQFDQLIDEFGSWVHVSWAPQRRFSVLKAAKVDGKTVYTRIP